MHLPPRELLPRSSDLAGGVDSLVPGKASPGRRVSASATLGPSAHPPPARGCHGPESRKCLPSGGLSEGGRA